VDRQKWPAVHVGDGGLLVARTRPAPAGVLSHDDARPFKTCIMKEGVVTASATNKITKYVTLRIPKNLRFRLSLRGRVVLARLARVGPMSARKLAKEHLGGLIRRERGLARALALLKEIGLAQHDSEGWHALEPTGEIRGGFRWLKDGKGAWYNRYQYTIIPLPKQPPWPKHNALELWCVYWAMKEMFKCGKFSQGMVARYLGITKKTVRNALSTLTRLGHLVRHGNKLTLMKIPTEYLTYEGQDYSEPDDESPLATDLRDLGIRDPERIIEKGAATGLYGIDLLSFAKRLHKRHDAGKWGDDPSKLILKAITNRMDHRARGGNK
jgi:hypothetical protein